MNATCFLLPVVLLVTTCHTLAAELVPRLAKGVDRYAETANPEASNRKVRFVSTLHEPGLPLRYSTYLMKGTVAEDAPVFVMMEYDEDATPQKMESFASEGLIPPGLVIFVMNDSLMPTVKGGYPRYMRGESFGRSGRGFPGVLIDELIPAAAKSCGVTVSRNPDMHFIAGKSAGGGATLNAVWFRNDYFRRAYAASPFLDASRGGEELLRLIRMTETKPLRIYITTGDSEPDRTPGDLFYDNMQLRAAFDFAGYPCELEYFPKGGHNAGAESIATMRRMFGFVWKDWRTTKVVPLRNPVRVATLVADGTLWEECAAPVPAKRRVSAAGGVYSCDRGRIVFMKNGVAKAVAGEFSHVEAISLSSDGWRLYVVDATRRDIFALTVEPDGTLGFPFQMAPIRLAHDATRLSASDIMTLENDRVLAATELGVQSTSSFGSLDVILPLPGDLPAERIWMDGRMLYALSGKRVFRRELLIPAARDGVANKPHNYYYAFPGENRNSNHRPQFEEAFRTLSNTVITNRIQVNGGGLPSGLVRNPNRKQKFWTAPDLMGRNFWAIMMLWPKSKAATWLGSDGDFPEDVLMFREAGIYAKSEIVRSDLPRGKYHASVLGMLGINDWMRAPKPKHKTEWVMPMPPEARRRTPYTVYDFIDENFNFGRPIDKSHPLFVNVHDVRPAYMMRSDGYPLADRDSYAMFKSKYPNCLGMIALNEVDSDTVYYDYFRQSKKLTDPIRALFEAKFPSRSDGGWRLRDWMRTCYSNAIDALWGETSLWPMPSSICGMLPMLGQEVAARGGNGIMYEATTQSPAPWELAGAFLRGAMRQNHINAGWYAAHWSESRLRTNVTVAVNGENRYNTTLGPMKPYCGPYRGASQSILVRQFLYGWLIGTSFFMPENWYGAYVAGTPEKFGLSEEGRAIDELYRMTKRVDRGVPITPVALLVPVDEPIWTGGWSGGLRDRYSQPAVFSTLIPTKSNNRWGGSLRLAGDQGCLFNSPFGEIFDVLTPDGGQSTEEFSGCLGSYACALLVGDAFDEHALDVSALKRYVWEGGTLVVSCDQVRRGFVDTASAGVSFGNGYDKAGRFVRDKKGTFPLEESYSVRKVESATAKPCAVDEDGHVLVWFNDVGEGRVITVACDRFLPDYLQTCKDESFKANFNRIISGSGGLGLLKFLLDRLQSETMPIRVAGDCEWGVNRTRDGYAIWIFNNAGVTKWANEPEEFDYSKTSEVDVVVGQQGMTSCVDARTGEKLPIAKGKVRLVLKPGEWRIVLLSER